VKIPKQTNELHFFVMKSIDFLSFEKTTEKKKIKKRNYVFNFHRTIPRFFFISVSIEKNTFGLL